MTDREGRGTMGQWDGSDSERSKYTAAAVMGLFGLMAVCTTCGGIIGFLLGKIT
jgi:hypothetical protein